MCTGKVVEKIKNKGFAAAMVTTSHTGKGHCGVSMATLRMRIINYAIVVRLIDLL